MWRKLVRTVGCLGYTSLLAVLFGLVSYFAFSQFVRRGVSPTPELRGLSEEQARALLADQGLRFEWSDEGERYDEQVPVGHVMAQKPRAGTLAKRGVPVTVVLSRGPQRIEVPSVVGEAQQAAQVTLAAAGLTLGRTIAIYSDRQPPGIVLAQEPGGGERVERDTAIDLFLVAEGVGDTYVMPDLVNRPYERVRRFFERRGFRLGRVSYETYEGIAPGTVLRQFPLAGHPLRRSDVIALGVAAPITRQPIDEPSSTVTPASDEVAPAAESEAAP